MASNCEVRETRNAEAGLDIIRGALGTWSLESGLRSKDSRVVRRGVVGKVLGNSSNSLASYPTSCTVLRGVRHSNVPCLPGVRQAWRAAS